MSFFKVAARAIKKSTITRCKVFVKYIGLKVSSSTPKDLRESVIYTQDPTIATYAFNDSDIDECITFPNNNAVAVEEQEAIPVVDEQETLTVADEQETLTEVTEQETLTVADEQETLTEVTEQETLTVADEQETLTVATSYHEEDVHLLSWVSEKKIHIYLNGDVILASRKRSDNTTVLLWNHSMANAKTFIVGKAPSFVLLVNVGGSKYLLEYEKTDNAERWHKLLQAAAKKINRPATESSNTFADQNLHDNQLAFEALRA